MVNFEGKQDIVDIVVFFLLLKPKETTTSVIRMPHIPYYRVDGNAFSKKKQINQAVCEKASSSPSGHYRYAFITSDCSFSQTEMYM